MLWFVGLILVKKMYGMVLKIGLMQKQHIYFCVLFLPFEKFCLKSNSF